MIRMQAWQQIYASVEEEQSPHGRGGFQTLFYSTAGLTESEVGEIEARLLYFPSEEDVVKRVFFSTSTGKQVLAQIVPLQELDQAGRGGRYLAHALIFSPEVFTQLRGSPFLVFRQFPFVTTVAEALERGDFGSGDLSPVELELSPEPEHELAAAQAWSPEALSRLALLALQADRLAGARSTVAMVGDARSIEQALEAAFLVVSTSLCRHCTFDSYFYRGNLVSTYYWAVGLAESSPRPNLIPVEARARRVLGSIPSRPESAYERWVMDRISGRELDWVARYRDHAFALGEWLEGRPHDDSYVQDAPEPLIRSILQANPEKVRAGLRRRLEERLPVVLADRIFEPVDQRSEDGERFHWLRQGFALPPLLDLLYESYREVGFPAPLRQEMRALEGVLLQAGHESLSLLLACWRDQRELLRRALEKLSEEAYRQFVETALAFALVDEPEVLIVPGRGDAFLDVFLSSEALVRNRLLPVAKALAERGEVPCLARLAPYVASRPRRERRALRRMVKKRPHLPEAFRQAVQDG